MATIPTSIQQDILSEINRVNGVSLTTAYVDVTDIRPTNTAGGRNTAVTVTAKAIAGNPYKGQTTFYYYRMDIGSLDKIIYYQLPPLTATKYSDTLNSLNNICKFDLRNEDIVEGTVSLTGQVGETFTLTCSDSSPRYMGRAVFTTGLTASCMMLGRIKVTEGSTYRIYTSGSSVTFTDNAFTTLLIGGVEHPLDLTASFKATVPTGEYDFSFVGPTIAAMGATLPITRLDRVVNFTGNLGLTFRDNRSLVEIGDNVFAGQQYPVGLSACFAGCTNLVRIGKGFCDFPGGFLDVGGSFNGATSLVSIGDTNPPPNGHPATEASSMFYNCTALEGIPAKFFWGFTNLVTARRLLYGVGSKAPGNLTVNKDTFKDFIACTAIDDLFTNSSLASIPAGLFDTMVNLAQAQQVFYTTSVPSIPNQLFRKNLKLASVTRCFSGIKVPVTVGKEILPPTTLTVDSTFRSTPIADISVDVFNGTKLTTTPNVFLGCTFQKPVPNLYHGQTTLTAMPGAFSSARIPTVASNQDLLKDCIALTDISTLFNGAYIGGGVVPAGLFEHNVNITAASQVFRSVSGVDETLVIPAGIFRNNSKITDLGYMFSYMTNVKLLGSVLPPSKSATNINYIFFSSDMSDLPADVLLYGDNVTTAVQAFSAMKITTVPAGILDSFSKLVTFSYAFFNTTTLTSIPAGLVANSPLLKDISYLLSGAPNVTEIPVGSFDNNPLITTIVSFAKGSKDLAIPKRLFRNCTDIANIASAFEGAKLRGYLDDLFHPGLVDKKPYCNGFMNGTDLTSVAKPTAPWNIPITGTMVNCFASTKNVQYTDDEFLAALPVSPSNKLVTTANLVTSFIGNCAWLYGTRDAMTKGLWQVDDALSVPANTVISAMPTTPNLL